MDRHARVHANSQNNLRLARDQANRSRNYDSKHVRDELTRLVKNAFEEQAPYDWQLDVAEALLLSLDSVVIAPTGAGKTLPFVMPVLFHPEKVVIIISPLIALQQDQVSRCKKLGLKAVAVNNETWCNTLDEEIRNGQYNVILAGPEICLQDTGFHQTLRTEHFSKSIACFVIDEAHCISQWGGEFRPSYGDLSQLRAFVPSDIPILATSATLPPKALSEVASALEIDLESSLFLNRGNDRPNICWSVCFAQSMLDFDVLRFVIPENVSSREDIPKTIIYTNSRITTQQICRFLRTLVPPHMRSSIAYFHAMRAPFAKRIVLKKFHASKIRILVATEAAGMGADIKDVKRVVQYGVPPSLPVWVQRAGRAGRDPSIEAEAILIAEMTMLKKRRARQKELATKKSQNSKEKDATTSDDDDDDDDEDGENQADAETGDCTDEVDEDGNLVYMKRVDPDVRNWVETEGCKRQYFVLFFDFDNPIIPPTGICCDSPIHIAERVRNLNTQSNTDTNTEIPERSRTPPPDSVNDSSTSKDSPSKHQNANGKRSMAKSSLGPKRRTKNDLKLAKEALDNWRLRTKTTKYRHASFTADGLLPQKVLDSLAGNARWKTVEDIKENLKKPWIFVDIHGQDVLDVLRETDEKEKRRKTNDKLRQHEERRREQEQKKIAERERREAERRNNWAITTPDTCRYITGTNATSCQCSVSAPHAHTDPSGLLVPMFLVPSQAPRSRPPSPSE